MEEKEIELIDYLKVIWRKKWMIVLGTILFMILSTAVSLLLKPVYEIDAIIQPGKFFIENGTGNFTEFVVESPLQVTDKVKYEVFNDIIAAELKCDKNDLPKIRAINIRDTLLVKVWTRSSNIEGSKKILNVLIEYLKKDIDKKIDIEINNIDTGISIKQNDVKSKEIEINSKKIEIDKTKQLIMNLDNKLKIIERRKQEIIEEMGEVKERITALEKEQASILKKEGRTESETLGMLLYSNEIQESLRFYNSMQETLSGKEIEKEDISIRIEAERERIKQLNNQIEAIKNSIDNLQDEIANLKEEKGRIDYTRIVKKPTQSILPVYPKIKLNVFIAFLLGLFVFSSLAFFIEYVEKKGPGSSP